VIQLNLTFISVVESGEIGCDFGESTFGPSFVKISLRDHNHVNVQCRQTNGYKTKFKKTCFRFTSI